MSTTSPHASNLILGAGLAGLSLADALLRQGVRSPIVIADAREDFTNDRTWGFWDVHPHPYRGLVEQRWSEWSFRSGATSYRQSSLSAPYCYLPADRFYEDVVSRLNAAPNCSLLLGTTIGDVHEEGAGVTVETSAGDLSASHLFDAMGTRGPTWPSAVPQPGPGVLCQRFLGWFLTTTEPVFDPSCVTLMDFDVTPNGELHFVYVLPFSSTRALVEDTTIGLDGIPPNQHREELQRYLGHRYGLTTWQVEREEVASIPMLHVNRSEPSSKRLIPVGTAAGTVRPSSGYAFVRTQLQVAALADRVAEGRPSAVPVGRDRDVFLDRVFLNVLQHDPEAFSHNLMMLAKRLSGDRFARFMMDAASPVDLLSMIAALPKSPFVRGAARVSREHVRR
ncbi:MAG: lycopene cyclase family protein [Thermoleophilia bacterium]